MTKLDRTAPLLITGSGGVLGTAVVKYLQAEGFTNLLTPNRQEMDLLSLASTEAYLRNNKPRYIIHLASIVYGLGGNLKYQLDSALNNTAINNNLFSAIQKYPVINFSLPVLLHPTLSLIGLCL
jgi:dTDP-4-dehydrorhamnose reductase